MHASSPVGARRRRSLAWWVRWLHTYVSLLSFGALIFFSITGLTLNHADWFEAVEIDDERRGSLPAELVGESTDPMHGLQLVNWVRRRESLGGHVEDPIVDEAEISLSFRGAGYVADVIIDRESGRYEVLETTRGLVAVMNDLHKGRHTSSAWKWLIDLSALVLAACGATGIWLLWFSKKVRVKGAVVGAIGTAALALVYVVWQ